VGVHAEATGFRMFRRQLDPHNGQTTGFTGRSNSSETFITTDRSLNTE
jgi:hypothetical protein